MSGECNLGSVTSQQKFEATDIKALRSSQLLDNVIAPSVLFRKQRKIILKARGNADPKDTKRRERGREKERQRALVHGGERERDPKLWLLFLFIYFFKLLG